MRHNVNEYTRTNDANLKSIPAAQIANYYFILIVMNKV